MPFTFGENQPLEPEKPWLFGIQAKVVGISNGSVKFCIHIGHREKHIGHNTVLFKDEKYVGTSQVIKSCS